MRGRKSAAVEDGIAGGMLWLGVEIGGVKKLKIPP